MKEETERCSASSFILCVFGLLHAHLEQGKTNMLFHDGKVNTITLDTNGAVNGAVARSLG